MSVKAKPFLKWAGGKARLVGTLSDLLPDEIETYYEPFIGGGALLFHLAQQGRFRRAVLNDFNPELANCYTVIRDSVDDLIQKLAGLTVSSEAFYSLRALDPETLPPVDRAARTIYLNKTCFNGLYRQNKRGAFNVPWGDNANPLVLDEPNLRLCSALLEHVRIRIGDFAQAVHDVEPGDAVYFDPPYVPLSATSNFKSYTAEGFTLQDQKRLADTCRDLTGRGIFIVESNSDTPTVHSLYEDFERIVVRMRRNINAKASSRGPVNELVIMSRQHVRQWDHRGL
jgi:DNA adenine methylase